MQNTAGFRAAAGAIAMLLAHSSDAQAALSSVATSFGAGTGVLDSVTGDTWLKFNALPSGLTYAGLGAKISSSGFGLATTTQIDGLIANAGPSSAPMAIFDALAQVLGAHVLDDAGNGEALGNGPVSIAFGGVDAASGPAVTLVPVDGSDKPTGPGQASTSHAVYTVNLETISPPGPSGPYQLFNNTNFLGNVQPDTFKTGLDIPFVTSPSSGFDYRDYEIQQGFEPFVGGVPDQNIARTTSGFWLVDVPATGPGPAVPAPGALVVTLGLLALAMAKPRVL